MKLLVANRGEIARRVIRTARSLGAQTVAVFADPDAKAPFVSDADQAVHIGPASLAESYLSIERIVQAIWPFLLVEFAVIFLITYFPSLTMTLPALAGFARCPSGAILCEALEGLTGG